MKKILFSLALLLCMSLTVNAQSSFVVKAGLNFNKLEDIKINNLEQSCSIQDTPCGTVVPARNPLQPYAYRCFRGSGF